MLAPVVHVLPLTTIVRERVLPVAGKVNMHVNQRVNPTDVVAEATFSREHVLLDVARIFGLSIPEADKLIRVNAGDPEADLGKLDRQGQPDISKPDHPDPGGFPGNLLKQLVIYR